MTAKVDWTLTPINLGRVDYLRTYEAMQNFTAARTAQTSDQLWLCEHPAVYTQGLAGKAEHIFNPGQIPVVQTNRGGQVTYHGPGQVVAYPMMDLKRAGYFIKEYVYRIEEAVIRTLMHFGVTGHRVAGAPGIYVRLADPAGHTLLANRPKKLEAHPTAQRNDSAPNFEDLGKIAALGIKISRNCTYHGVALNVAMDLEPYSRINPCGYAGLQSVDLSTIGVSVGWAEAADVLGHKLTTYLAP
jgi:lipoyl(octanoyl) transferase